MKAVCGFKIKLPIGPAESEVIQKFRQLRDELYLIVEESLQDKYILIGAIFDRKDNTMGMGGWSIPWRGSQEPPDWLVKLCQETGVSHGVSGYYIFVSAEMSRRVSHYTFALVEEYEKISRKKTQSFAPEFGGWVSVDLSLEETQWEHRTMPVILGQKNYINFQVTHTRRFKFPGTIINLIEDLTIPESTNYLTLFSHPVSLVNFSHLQAERKNLASYWAYLPADLIQHYIFPMLNEV